MDRLEKTLRMYNNGTKEVKNIPIICTWCNKVYQISQWEISEEQEAGVSHGVCPECQAKHEKEEIEKLNEAAKHHNDKK